MKWLNKKTYPLVIAILLFIVIYALGSQIPEEAIGQFVEKAGVFGPVLIILLLWSTSLIAPLSGSPFTFAGFYLFGNWIILYGSIATLISFVTNFWIAKIWGRRIVMKLAGADALVKIDKLAKEHGPKTLLVFRIILWQYHDVISYAFGLTKISFSQYILISILGMIPGTILFYILTLKVTSPVIFIVLTFAMACVCLGGYFLLEKLRKKK